MPEVVFGHDGHYNGIQYLLGVLLLLLNNGAIINHGLESLPVFTLKCHLQLLPPGLCGVSFFGIDVEGLWEVDGPDVEYL